ncbi:MAG: V-type ATP synthase subunit E [Euryarchaeota archaeon]|nr:V-type ATP synthase subunit E [Euryarchaeota archaeon]
MADSVDRIVEKILADARARAAEFDQEAQRKIDEIREEEESRWEKEKARLEAEFRREAEDIRIQILSRAHMEGKRLIVNAREEVINRVIEAIRRGIRDSSDYSNYLRRSVENAREILGDKFVVKCIPEDKETVNAIVSEVAPGATVEIGMIRNGGLLVESMDGLRVVDYSVDALVSRRMQDIRKMILDKLFEGEYA